MAYSREWIVRYHGDLQTVLARSNVAADMISERYALIKTEDIKIPYLQSLIQIECMYQSQPMFQVIAKTEPTQAFMFEKKKDDLRGKGVALGWINHKDKANILDQCKGEKGIVPDSQVILVDWTQKHFYMADAIRAVRFIIKKANRLQAPLVIYFPFDLSKEDEDLSLVREIICDMSLWGRTIIVSALEQDQPSPKLNLSIDYGPVFSTWPALTVGALALMMEWGLVRGYDPALYGQQLRTKYIKEIAYQIKQDRENRSRTLDLGYEFAPDDAVIDAFIIYNNFNTESLIMPTTNASLYPLVFPYLGIRGTSKRIKEVLAGHPEKLVTGSLAYILSNEPLDIKPANLKEELILSQANKLTGEGCLIGIIDTGIDYTNPVFIDSKGKTRIVSIWDQTIGKDSPYGYGSTYNSEMINKALESDEPFKVVPHRDETGSGTILAGIAAGNMSGQEKTYQGAGPGASIAVVKLATASPIMQDIYYGTYHPLAFSALDIARAFEYLVTLSNEHKKPISIFLPMGTNTGSHDGTSILDTIIMSYAENLGISIILPAGEEANKRHHASGSLKEEEEQAVKLKIPEGQDGFMVEIWADFGDRIQVFLTAPQSELEENKVVSLNKQKTYKVAMESLVWSQGSKIDEDTGWQVIRFRFQNPVVGEWVITLRGLTIVEGGYHIWIPKTGMILPDTVLSPADPFTTIYNTSSARKLMSVACYDPKSLSPTPSSGRGFTRDGRVTPDFMVEGVDIVGPLPNKKWGSVTGTAVSCAITAGMTSLIYEQQLIQKEEISNTITMKAILINQLKREPTVSYPNPSRGYGLLEAKILLEANTKLRKSAEKPPNLLGIPYEIVPEEAVIDAFITYNSLNPDVSILPSENTKEYPLTFPYSGFRGPRVEIEEMMKTYLGKESVAFIPAVLGNEPLGIRQSDFKSTSLVEAALGLGGAGTLIGMIDTGIDYTHPVFMDANGQTRISCIWDQTIAGDSPYGFGAVYDREMINKALESPDPFLLVPHKDEDGHGTMLSGIAAGFDSNQEGIYRGVAPEAELVIVKLRPASEPMQKFYYGKNNPLGFSALDVALAFQFITNFANQIQKPVSICLPQGTNTGSHDGTNALNYIISSTSFNSGVSTIVSAGDEADKNHHASGDLKENEKQVVKLRIPKNQLGFVVEIWGGFGDKIEALLTSPTSGNDDPVNISLNEEQIYELSKTSSVWSQGIKLDTDTGCQVIRFRFENPIEGDWEIRIQAVVVVGGIYHIWIPKTGMILKDTVLSPVSPFTTVYSTSTANGIIAIGCHNKASQSVCRSSGRGFTRDDRVTPHFVAPGVDIRGPLPDNKWGLITGSAPASAIGAGVCSIIYQDQLTKGEELANTLIMKAILVDHVKREITLSYPNPSSGYGLIDIHSKLY